MNICRAVIHNELIIIADADQQSVISLGSDRKSAAKQAFDIVKSTTSNYWKFVLLSITRTLDKSNFPQTRTKTHCILPSNVFLTNLLPIRVSDTWNSSSRENVFLIVSDEGSSKQELTVLT